MELLVLAMDNPELNDKLRTYSLYKSPHFFGYGIAFHTERIQPSLASHKLVYPLIEIESQSPAEEAGMRNGQRVVAVNGAYVNADFKSLEDVVQAIEDSYYSRNFTDITVLDPALWAEFMQSPESAARLADYKRPATPQPQPQPQPSPIVERPSKPDVSEPPREHVEKVESSAPLLPPIDVAVPRLCRLVRAARDDQYGFDFKTLKNEGKHIANNVRPSYPAARAGLRDGDYILEVNDIAIDGMEHDAVVNKISANPRQVDLLVVGDLAAYLSKSAPSQQASASRSRLQSTGELIELNIPHQHKDVSYHRVVLIPGYKGLGISLTPNGTINSIDANSPSDKAGLRKDQRIVEVNGVDVRDKSNKEIAKHIKENEANLVIGVVNPTFVAAASEEPSAEASLVSETLVGQQQGSISSATGKRVAGKWASSLFFVSLYSVTLRCSFVRASMCVCVL